MIIVAIGFTICALYVLDFAVAELLASVFSSLDEDLSLDDIEFVKWSPEK